MVNVLEMGFLEKSRLPAPIGPPCLFIDGALLRPSSPSYETDLSHSTRIFTAGNSMTARNKGFDGQTKRSGITLTR